MAVAENRVPARPAPLVFAAGAAVGLLGGMVGLGGAEFRLPLLISLFGFAALSLSVDLRRVTTTVFRYSTHR